MNGIKINSHLRPLQDCLRQVESKQNTSKCIEPDNTPYLSQLKQSADNVKQVYESQAYRLKTANITQQVLENRYEIKVEQWIDQLLAEEGQREIP